MTLDEMPEIKCFSIEEIEKCESNWQMNPMLFEIYMGVGLEANLLASISLESSGLSISNQRNHTVLLGLVNRCAKLMLANVKLTHKGRGGEAAAIMDRSIFESSLIVMWLCNSGTENAFERYLANGLRGDLELENTILQNIEDRGSDLPIEKRMLLSIENHVVESGLTREEITVQKKLPNVASMLSKLDYERLVYIVCQRIGSHHTHGTWSSLLYGYVEKNDVGVFVPRDDDVEMHPNQFIVTSFFVLNALHAYIEETVAHDATRNAIKGRLDRHAESIDRIQNRIAVLDAPKS